MSNIQDRIASLDAAEIASIKTDLLECHGLTRILTNPDRISHIDQAEVRTMFARHYFPIAETEVYVACTTILNRARAAEFEDIVFPEEIFPQEIG